jgi:hypothetical protein
MNPPDHYNYLQELAKQLSKRSNLIGFKGFVFYAKNCFCQLIA